METLKVTLREVFDMRVGVEKLFNQEMPIKVSYRLSKLAKQIKTELEHLEEIRSKLVKKYGEEVKDGNVKVKEEHFAEFMNEFNVCLDETVELSFDRLNLSDLEHVSLTPFEVSSLSCLLAE